MEITTQYCQVEKGGLQASLSYGNITYYIESHIISMYLFRGLEISQYFYSSSILYVWGPVGTWGTWN
uniref:Uncharacterized protein n=1 Tax=Picea glauca TaxID=3330 RepID=A0A117NHI2_PICGL|nr:hypothetical protein ABT39_MTgene4438 [Picea glauca]